MVSTVAMSTATSTSFQYQYRITANSNHPFEYASVYSYREKLIAQYESLCFSHSERDYQDILMQNISSFRFDEFCTPSYYNGELRLIIGNGLGRTYTGKLKKNACDEETVHEKLYIYELFH